MIKLGSLINSEGPILELTCNYDGKLTLKALSIEHQGFLSFSVRFSEVVSYIDSRITLSELISLSKDCLFSFNTNTELKRIPLKIIIDSIPYSNLYYKDIPDSMK